MIICAYVQIPGLFANHCGQVFYLNLLVLEAKPFRHPGHTPPGHLFSIWCVKRSLLYFSGEVKPEKTWQYTRKLRKLVCLLFFLAVSGNRATPLREHDLGFSALHDLDQSDAVIPVLCERFERQVIRRILIQIHLVNFDGSQGSARRCKLAF